MGKVIEIKENKTLPELEYRNKEIIFEIIEYYKGVPKAQKKVTVYTSFWSTSCGLPVRKAGEIWFLFANAGTNNLLFTSVCSYSKKTDEPENEFLMKLRHYSSADGYTVFYNNDNTISAEGKIGNNLPEGDWKYYIRNGEIYKTGSFIKGQKDGPWTQYGRDNKIISIDTYKNGKRHGIEITYHDNGLPDRIVHYSNDRMEGEILQYYKSGTLMIKGYYKEGPAGEWIAYYKNGEIACSKINETIWPIDEEGFTCESKRKSRQ
jgi:hypothetical protein